MKYPELDITSPFGQRQATAWKRWVWQFCNARFLSAGLRRKLRKRYARKITGPFDFTHESINYRLYPAENHCDRTLFSRNHLPELAEHRALDGLIRPGMTFVDVGANIGSYSLYVANKSVNDATILALEPHPRTYQKLLFNFAANGVATNNVLQLASGERRSVMQLWSDGGSNIGHTSLLKAGTSNPKISVDVEVVPLQEILSAQGIENIDVLKIDVEGFEDQVLLPFFQSVPRTLWPGAVLIETAHRHIWQSDVIAHMADIGYSTRFETEENLLLEI